MKWLWVLSKWHSSDWEVILVLKYVSAMPSGLYRGVAAEEKSSACWEIGSDRSVESPSNTMLVYVDDDHSHFSTPKVILGNLFPVRP